MHNRANDRITNTVEPSGKGHFGETTFVPCREVVPILEVFYFSSLHPNEYIFSILNFYTFKNELCGG